MVPSTTIAAYLISACWELRSHPLESAIHDFLEEHADQLALALELPAGARLRPRRLRKGVDLVFELIQSGSITQIIIIEIKVSAAENFSKNGFQSKRYLQDHDNPRAILLHLNSRPKVVAEFVAAGWESVDLAGLGLLPPRGAPTSAAAVLDIAGRTTHARRELEGQLRGMLPQGTMLSWRLRPGARVSHWLDIQIPNRPDILVGYDRRIKAVSISTHTAAFVTAPLPDDPAGRKDFWDGCEIKTIAAWKWLPPEAPKWDAAVKDIAKTVQTVQHAA